MATSRNISVDLGNGIHLVDTGFQRPQMAACYIVEDAGQVAIVETGTKDTVPLICEALDELSLTREQVQYVIVTHVHLDHAGGAGRLMAMLPNAKLVVHEKGARHMIDPSKLQAGATAVYGKAEFDKTYGDLLPIPQNQILVPNHEERLNLGDRTLMFIDTPGHANHHFCVFDSLSKGFFTGDTFGLAYQELVSSLGPFIFPTTTPVQLNPEALKASIRTLLSYQPTCMYLTHYGKVKDVERLGDKLLGQVDELVAIALSVKDHESRLQILHEKVMEWLMGQLEQWELDLSTKDIENVIRSDAFLNAQGLDVWLSKL